ncbi:hypothetical protein BAZMOX_112116_0 [methanotrophic endosymbiont of Bathymodiolus azoricus (Menez Gwen)]|nr:hypothetical protein BAZMOX_112116_0 [methanotrophic endosymbiont of Bathymodiolus azoricus (Menez Gwen)]
MKTEAEETYANGRTLENAKEVVRQMKSDADKEYHNGVAKRTELRQWPNATAAANRIQGRYDHHEAIRVKARYGYSRYKHAYGSCWWGGVCLDHESASELWATMRNTVGLDIAPAKARIKPSGTTMGTELARTKLHLIWAMREKQRALTTQATVKNTFNTTRYNPVAYRTVNTANAEITWAEKSVKNALNEIKMVSGEVLERARQAKYSAAVDYFNEQKAIYYAEQEEVEMANINLMTVLLIINRRKS